MSFEATITALAALAGSPALAPVNTWMPWLNGVTAADEGDDFAAVKAALGM